MGSSPKPAKTPDAAKTYQQGIDVFLKNNPTLLDADQQARADYDNPSVERALSEQETYGPALLQTYLDRLKEIDPAGTAARQQQGDLVSAGLDQGYSLPADLRRDVQQTVRARQAATGNTMGNASAADEALAVGQAGSQLYQQRLTDAGAFQSGPTPEAQFSLLPNVQPDRSQVYTNPNAGYEGQNFAQNNFQNVLAQQQLAAGQGNPWMSAVGAGVKVAGATYGGSNGWGQSFSGSSSWLSTPSSGQGSGIFGGNG